MSSLFKACFIFYIVFFNCLYAVELNDTFSKILVTHKNLLTYVDSTNSKSIDDILKNQNKLFTQEQKDFFTYSSSSIWTKLTLKNSSDKALNFYIVNDFPSLDEIDIYIIKDKKIYKELFFGDKRKVLKKDILARFININLNLDANENIELIIKYTSFTPINTKLKIYSNNFYYSFMQTDSTIWGFFLGITLALIVYNLMIYFSLKQKAFLFYVLYALANLYNAFSTSGHVYSFLGPMFSYEILDRFNAFTQSLSMIFASFFMIYLFNLKKNIYWLYKINIILIYIMSIFTFLILLFNANDCVLIYNKILAILIQISLFTLLFSTMVIAYKRLLGSIYFLFGTGVYFLSVLLYVLYFLGKVDFGIWIIYAFPLGITIDVVFSSMALGKRIKRLEIQRLENAILVEESNKFNSSSYLLAGVLHQFKQPIIHLGSEILNLRVVNFKKNQNDIEENSILKNMENQITDMNNLVENFYSFYSKKSHYGSFNLADAIDKTLNILSSSLLAYNIKVKKEYKTLSITSDEKSLNQIMLIILENAIAILVERKIDKPTICISVNKNNKHINIIIEDNAGGIDADDIKKVFTVHYSKKEEKGLGLGLALAKNLIQNKLNGKIEVENTNNGASFKIQI